MLGRLGRIFGRLGSIGGAHGSITVPPSGSGNTALYLSQRIY